MATKTFKVALRLDDPRLVQTGISVHSFDKQSVKISITLIKDSQAYKIPTGAQIKISMLKVARQEQKIILDVPNNSVDSIEWVVPDYLDGYSGTVRCGVYLIQGDENIDLGYFNIASNVSDIDNAAEEFTDSVMQGWDQIEADLAEIRATITQVNTLASDATSKYDAFNTSVTQAGQEIDDILALQPQFQSILDETTGKDVISAPEIIAARDGFDSLGERLDSDKAEVSAQLAQNAKYFIDYKPSGNGVGDDAPKLQQALNELPDGGTLHLGGSDKTYRLDSRVTVTGKTVHLVANGATLMQGFNGEMFVYTGKFGTPVAVTGISTESAVFGDSGGTVVTKLTAPNHTFEKGDVIKVVSDDLLVGSRQSTARSGEYQVIQMIVGDDLYLSGKLRDIDIYETNVRAVKHEEKTITVDGINLTAAPESDLANWNFGFMVVNGAFRPTFNNMLVHDGHAPALTLTGCYAYIVNNLKGRNLTNDPSKTRYGYGINDKNSEYGIATNLHFENVRHGFTTNASSVPADSLNFWRYGRPAYFIVSDSTGIGTTNATFDTHEESYGGQFVNCTARGVVKGKSSSGSCFTARGKMLRYDNCRAYDSAVGWQVLSAYAGDTGDILINNCESHGITAATVSVQQGTNGSRIKDIRMRGGRHHTTNKFVYAIGGKVDVRNVDVEAPFDSAGLDGILRVDSADIYLDEVRLDMSGSLSTNIQVVKIQDNAFPADSWSIITRRLEVILPDGVNYFARGDGQDATNKLILTDLVLSRNVTLTSSLAGTPLINYTIVGDLKINIIGKINLTGSTPALRFNNNAEFNFDGVNFNMGAVVDEVLKKYMELKSSELVLNDSIGSAYFRAMSSPANGYTGVKTNYRADGVTKHEQVRVGAVDSGGEGFRILIIPN